MNAVRIRVGVRVGVRVRIRVSVKIRVIGLELKHDCALPTLHPKHSYARGALIS